MAQPTAELQARLRSKGRQRVRHVWQFSLSLGLLLTVLVLGICVGSVPLQPSEVLGALTRSLLGRAEGADTVATIIWDIRLPRVILAGLVGAALSISGATFQGVFRNPLADPYLLGAASGAGLGATLALLFLPPLPGFISGVTLMSFLFALACVALTTLLAYRRGQVALVSLILAGAVLGSFTTAMTSLFMLWQQDDAARVLGWLLGSFALSSWLKIESVLLLMVLSAMVMWVLAYPLNVLQLGEDMAVQLGVRVTQLRYTLIVVATLATAAAVSVSGIIGFVGLIVPHALRLAFGGDYRTLLPLSLIYGAIFMVLADVLARSVLAPQELPIGVITVLIGGPLFLYLMRRST